MKRTINHIQSAVLILMLACLTGTAAADDNAAGNTVTTLQQPLQELIVKFVAGSEVLQATELALQNGVKTNDDIERLVRGLSEQLQVPLSVQGITSGQEIVLVVGDSQSVDYVAEYLRQRADIDYVQANTMSRHYGESD